MQNQANFCSTKVRDISYKYMGFSHSSAQMLAESCRQMISDVLLDNVRNMCVAVFAEVAL